MHSGASLGDDAALAEAPRQQDLAQGVVELVRAGMVQVLALEVEPQAVGQTVGRRARSLGQDAGLGQDLRTEPIGSVHGRGPAPVVELELAQLGPEARIVTRLPPGAFELVERRDERLGHVATAEVAVQAPLAVLVGFEEGLWNRRGSGRHVWPVEACRPGPLHE